MGGSWELAGTVLVLVLGRPWFHSQLRHSLLSPGQVTSPLGPQPAFLLLHRILAGLQWPGHGKHFSNYGGINNSPKIVRGTYPVVQWLTLHTPNAESSGLVLGQGTRSHMPQLRLGAAK